MDEKLIYKIEQCRIERKVVTTCDLCHSTIERSYKRQGKSYRNICLKCKMERMRQYSREYKKKYASLDFLTKI